LPVSPKGAAASPRASQTWAATQNHGAHKPKGT
jgi:hypothetical protein